MFRFLIVSALSILSVAEAQMLQVDANANLKWTNSLANGFLSVETADSIAGPWRVTQNFFVTGAVAQATTVASNGFFRTLTTDGSFDSLTHAYGVLSTVAGNGFGRTDNVNYWQPSFEGGFATDAALSRPHFAMTDDADNLYIVDKCSHSVLKVTRDGRIHTVAGNHTAGDVGDGPAPAISLELNNPNGLWVRGDGVFYILDTGNGKIRKVDQNGTMTTLYSAKSGIVGGRGLWVSADESVIYFCSGTALRKRANGNTTTVNNNFIDPSNITVNSHGDVLVTDRADDKVYLVDDTGSNAGNRSLLYGSGDIGPAYEGTPAANCALYGVRGIWPFPLGGYLLATHEGSQALYVDTSDIVHVLVDGVAGNMHDGDGEWFMAPSSPKMAELRSISMDRHGNIFIVENDYGHVRKIEFLRMTP